MEVGISEDCVVGVSVDDESGVLDDKAGLSVDV